MSSTENPRSAPPHRNPPKEWPCYGAPGYRGAPRFPRAEHTPLPSGFHIRRPTDNDHGYRTVAGILIPGTPDHGIRVGDEIHPINSPEDLDVLGRDLVAFYQGLDFVVLEDGFQIGQRIIKKTPRRTVLTVDLVIIVPTFGESGSIINPKIDVSQGDVPFDETFQVDFSGTSGPITAYFTPFHTYAHPMNVSLAMHIAGSDSRSGTPKGRS